MNKRFLLAAFVASVSFCSFAEELDHWLVDATAKTMTDNVWTFAATIDTSKKTVTVGACVEGTGFPAEVSTLDLSKTVKDASDNVYTITSLGTMFGKTTNNWKDDSVYSTTGLTLGKLILPATGITSIGNGAFGGCTALTNVVNFLPDSVTSVGQAVFYTSNVRNDLYVYGVSSFDRCAFTGVPIASVHFGKNLTWIGNGSNKQAAFQNCNSLTNVTFHLESKGIDIAKCGISSTTAVGAAFPLRLYGVSVVGESGFQGLKATEVVFDRGIRLISSADAFKNCQFQKVTFLGAPPASWKVIYSGANSKVTTYVPAAYRAEWEKLTAGPIPDDGETTFSEAVCSAAGISNLSLRPVKLIPDSLPVSIGTAADFVAQLSTNAHSYIKLTADVDLTGSGYTTLARFDGVLDGQGHALSGVGAQPLFKVLCGVVRNLTLDGSVGGANTTIPFVAKENRGALCDSMHFASVSDVKVKGYRVRAPAFAQTSWVGLFAGRVYNESTIERCETDAGAELCGSNNGYGGGFVGLVGTAGSPACGPSFVDCTNRAACSFSQEAYNNCGLGGFVGIFSVGAFNSQMLRCVNYGNLSSLYKNSMIGGIFGTGGASAGNDGRLVIADCANYGTISATATAGGFWLGGIGGASGLCLVLSNCVNRAEISTESISSYSSGICSNPLNEFGANNVQRFYNCANYANVTASVQAGGISAYSKSNKDYGGTGIYYKNCANYGTLTATITDEFVPAGPEGKSTMYYARSNRKVDNAFAMTRNIEYFKETHPATKWWFTVTNAVTAADVGYEVKSAVATLNGVATEYGLGEWCVGLVGGQQVPELKMFSLSPVVSKVGLMIFFR